MKLELMLEGKVKAVVDSSVTEITELLKEMMVSDVRIKKDLVNSGLLKKEMCRKKNIKTQPSIIDDSAVDYSLFRITLDPNTRPNETKTIIVEIGTFVYYIKTSDQQRFMELVKAENPTTDELSDFVENIRIFVYHRGKPVSKLGHVSKTMFIRELHKGRNAKVIL